MLGTKLGGAFFSWHKYIQYAQSYNKSSIRGKGEDMVLNRDTLCIIYLKPHCDAVLNQDLQTVINNPCVSCLTYLRTHQFSLTLT